MRRQSLYVPMRDGIKLAVDVFLPQEVREGKTVPTILHQTRYFRAAHLRWPFNLFLPDNPYAGIQRRCVKNGYAWVSLDVRGTGASFGYVKVAFSKEQLDDAREIVDWIVQQHWSDGQIGAYGASYDGICAELLLIHKHPAIKAVMPIFSPHDLYEDIIFPGGVFLSWFSKEWGEHNKTLDQNALKEMMGLPGRMALKGVRPVDEDRDRSLLDKAIAAHSKNWDIYDTISKLECRDDKVFSGEDLCFDDLSPHALVDNYGDSRVPVYSYSGWFDAAYSRAAIKRFLSATNPHSRLILGPWDHGGFHNVSPSMRRKNRFDHTDEALRFFNYHLKGLDAGITKEPRVKYYTMIEDRWKKAAAWPPAGVRIYPYFLSSENGLTHDAPTTSQGYDSYRVDNSVGSGTKSRWRTLTLSVHGALLYSDRKERDAKLLTYTSDSLNHDLEVTGHPLVHIYMSSNTTDASLFVYLEDVDEKGRVTMVTEGQLRTVHRKLSSSRDIYKNLIPHRSFLSEDVNPLIPGEVTELVFDMIPTSYVFRKNHSIRIAVAGADRDHFATPHVTPPLLRIYRTAQYPSRVELPIKKELDCWNGQKQQE